MAMFFDTLKPMAGDASLTVSNLFKKISNISNLSKHFGEPLKKESLNARI